MAELTIESIPSGADVNIDGEAIGTTPITFSIGESVGLTEFRSQCLSNGKVVSSWNTLKTRLEDQTVSGIWWDLTRDERYSIAEMAIKNTLFYNIFYTRTGKPNCGGGEGELKRATCVNSAIIRCIKFGELPDTVPYWSQNADMCYYRKQPVDAEHCYVSNTPYKLPCHYVSMISEFAVNHAMAAIQIENNYNSLDSWIVFQHTSFDIKPGHRQMPYKSTVYLSKPNGFQCGVTYGTRIAEFGI